LGVSRPAGRRRSLGSKICMVVTLAREYGGERGNAAPERARGRNIWGHFRALYSLPRSFARRQRCHLSAAMADDDDDDDADANAGSLANEWGEGGSERESMPRRTRRAGGARFCQLAGEINCLLRLPPLLLDEHVSAVSRHLRRRRRRRRPPYKHRLLRAERSRPARALCLRVIYTSFVVGGRLQRAIGGDVDVDVRVDDAESLNDFVNPPGHLFMAVSRSLCLAGAGAGGALAFTSDGGRGGRDDDKWTLKEEERKRER